MNTLARIGAFAAIGVIFASCGSGGSGVAPATTGTVLQNVVIGHRLSAPLPERSIVAMTASATHLCAVASDPSHASCLSSVRMSATRDTQLSDLVDGLSPLDLSNIYGYAAPNVQSSTNAVVGIIVAYDYANVESDLAVYRAKFGLGSCTTASGCFKKVGAAASTTTTTVIDAPTSISAHPTTNSSGWAAEADADTQAVSGVCRKCKIVLAEAASDSLTDLASAASAAVSGGATILNASFGSPENASQSAFASALGGSSVKVVAAAGDGGRGVLFPASLPDVIAVAGTTLNTSAGGLLVTESLWPGSGGGCSTVFTKASYQPAWCGSKRSVADVAVVADPADGIAFFDSGLSGWGIVGGTSIAAPIVASMFALSANTAAGTGAQQLYAHSSQTYSPVANAGFVGGLGTPLSLAAF